MKWLLETRERRGEEEEGKSARLMDGGKRGRKRESSGERKEVREVKERWRKGWKVRRNAMEHK